jgi:hypothetical protein
LHFPEYYGTTFAIFFCKCSYDPDFRNIGGVCFTYRVGNLFKTRRKLKQVADNGYETARDVLFPGKKLKSSKLHYGPVHPGLK